MVYWKDIESDVRVAEIGELFRKIGSLPDRRKWVACRNVTEFIIKSVEEPVIIITESCQKSLYSYLQSSKKELGGLLLGRTYSLPYNTVHGYSFISFITDSIPSVKFKSSAVSLTIDAEIWNRTRDYLDHGKVIIGWYHSHPGMGAFFSATDQLTQKSFFSNAYSLGIVIDPCRNEIKCYFGTNSNEILCHFQVMPDELASLCLLNTIKPDSDIMVS